MTTPDHTRLTPTPGGLAEGFAPRRHVAPPPPPTAARTAAQQEREQATRPAPRPKRSKKTATARAAQTPPKSAEADATLTLRRTVFLPDELFEKLRTWRVSSGLTSSELTLLAIAATHNELPDLVAEDEHAANASVPTTATDLFGDLQLRQRFAPAAKRQLAVSWTRHQIEVIDALVEQVGAHDRSHMVTLALRAWTGPATS